MMLLKQSQPMSLLDQKKLQWAKEKEELNGLWSPWGRPGGQTPGYVQDDSRNKRRTSGPLITLSTVNKLCSLTSSGCQSEYHLPPIIQPGNHQSPPNTADDCAYCNPSLLKRKSSLPASMEVTSVGELYERQKSYTLSHAELTEHHARKASILKQTQRDRYDEHNYTSGYQSEVFGEEFGSRNGSGDSGRVMMTNNGKEYHSLPRPSHGQSGHNKSKSKENDANLSRYTKETDRRHSYCNNPPTYGTWHSTTSLNPQNLPSAMRSSFTNAIDAADSNAFRDIQQREKQEWLHELEKQRDEQRQRKLMEKEETRPKWGDRGVVVGHLWEPSEVATARLPQQREDNGNYSQYPGWVEKSPNRLGTAESAEAEVNAYPLHSFDILVDHHQSQDTTNSEKTFIRGQNVPIDPDVFAEREKKRMAALKHQEEIRKQMEERQFQLKQDREKRLAEERLDEERIANQRREELRRLDIEKRQINIAQEEKELEPEIKYDPMAEHQRKKSILDRIHKRRPASPDPIVARPQKSAEAILQMAQDRIQDMEDRIIIEPRRNSLTLLPPIPNQEDTWSKFQEIGINTQLSPTSLNRSPIEELLRSRSLTRETAGTQTDETRILEDVVKTSVKSKSTTNLVHPPPDLAQKKKERPRWGVVPPKVQYIKQSEKDPNFHLRQKRKDRMKRREQQLQHAAVLDTESEDGRQPGTAVTKGVTTRQPLKASHTNSSFVPAKSVTDNAKAALVNEEVCQKETSYYTTTIRPAATYRQSSESVSNTSKYQHLTPQERLLLQAYDNEESAAESSQFSSSPASYEKELDFKSALITDEEIRLSRSLTRKRTVTNSNQRKTVSQQRKSSERQQHNISIQQQSSESQRQQIMSESQSKTYETPQKMSETQSKTYETNQKITKPQPKATSKPKTNDTTKKNLILPHKKIEAVIAFQNPQPQQRSNSPPVPAVLKKMQKQGLLLEQQIEKIDQKPEPKPVEPLSPPLPDFIKKMDDDDEIDSFLSSESTSEDLESKVQPVSTTKYRVRSNKSKISSNTHILDMPLSDYEKIPHISDVSPRYMTKGDQTRQGAKGEKLISYVMQNEEVQAQLSARESELSSRGIIEFSIKLPPGQGKGSKSKVSVVQGKKSVKQKEEEYMDPLESARRRATINWVNSKENGKGVLSHLSQLKQGIKQQQYQWGVVPADSGEDELHSLKNYPHN